MRKARHENERGVGAQSHELLMIRRVDIKGSMNVDSQ